MAQNSTLLHITDHDIDILARTIYGEARGEDAIGKGLVADVIMNRYRTKYRRKTTITDVCQDKWQFSCWNRTDPNLPKLLSVDLSDETFRRCFVEALFAVDGEPDLPPLTRHYYAKSMPEPPTWAIGHSPVVTHGRHLFFEGIA